MSKNNKKPVIEEYSDDESEQESSHSQLSRTDSNPDVDSESAISNVDQNGDVINEYDEPGDPSEEEETGIDNNKIETENATEDEIEINDLDSEIAEKSKKKSKICYMKKLNRKIKDFTILEEDDSNMYGKMKYKKIPKEERISDPIMTYYELTRIIGTRAQQFNLQAKPFIDGTEGLTTSQQAYVELMAGMNPFIIRRHLPGKCYEDWEVNELEIIHTINDDFFVPKNFNLQKSIN